MDTRTKEEAGKLLVCTLCGASTRDPITNSICMDVFCKICIEEYLQVTVQYLSSHTSKSPKTTSYDAECPVCEKEFKKVNLMEGLHKDNPAVMYVKKKAKDRMLTDKVRIANFANDSKINLKECESVYNNILEQLKFLEDTKVKDLNAIKQSIDSQINMTIKNIQIAGRLLIKKIEDIILDFKNVIIVKKKYLEFVQKNCSKLLNSLKHNYDESSNEIIVGLNIEKISDRSNRIKKQSSSIEISDTLLSRYSYKNQTSTKVDVGNIVNCVDPYPFPTDIPQLKKNVFEVSHEKDSPRQQDENYSVSGMKIHKRWSRCFRNSEQRSMQPSGISFSNLNRNLIVAEFSKERLVSLNAKNGEYFETFFEKPKFNPLSLTRLSASHGDEETFATIDKHSNTVNILSRNKFRSIETKFGLPQAVSHHGENFLITDNHDKNLSLMTYDGKILWSVGSKTQTNFNSPHYLSVCQHSHRIFVSDGISLKIYDINGNFIKSVTEQNWTLKGSCLDSRGNIFVVENSKNRLLKLDHRDAKYIGDVSLGNQLSFAQDVTMSDDDRNLCLTQGDGNVAFFQIY